MDFDFETETEGELIAKEASDPPEWCKNCKGTGWDPDQADKPCPNCSGVKSAAMDSPFDGYGRPFSDDPLGMSETYFHDNPAQTVGPYSGPSDYSINTVTPYSPPQSGVDNPGQNVGPYKRSEDGVPEVEVDEEEDDGQQQMRQAYRQWSETQWFDGTSGSIYDRSVQAQALQRRAAAVGDFVLEDELSEQVDVLNKTAAEYDESALHEFVDELPGGTVALEYDDLVDGGLVDLSSFLSTASHRLAKEVSEFDWETFKTDGARVWVSQKIADNPGLIKHEVMCRQAAVDYAKDKTMVLMDPVRRAGIIDEFVTAAERFRRSAAKRLLADEKAEQDRQDQIEAARFARVAMEVEDMISNPLPGDYTKLGPDYDDEGYLDLGPDDGSPLYEAAMETVQAARGQDWPNFTTEGAKDWYFERVVDTPMAKHADITYRAARTFALDQAAGVPDTAQRNEIARAFTESVEYLRQTAANEQPEEAEEEPTIDEYFGEEHLW